MNKEQAKLEFENIIKLRNSSLFPFTEEQEKTFRVHCLVVADFAEKVAANIFGMDAEKAYVLGLLHDCGRIKDEKAENVFHGLVGYKYMMQKNQPEIARISLTHSFYEKDFNLETYPQNKESLLFCKDLLKNIEYNDYDLLIQLSDMTNDVGRNCTIEYRFDSISKRYNVPHEKLEPIIEKMNQIKHYFDRKANNDIYKFIENINDKPNLSGPKNSPKNMARGNRF